MMTRKTAAAVAAALTLAACSTSTGSGSTSTSGKGGASAAPSGPAAMGDTVATKKAEITASNFRDTGAGALGGNFLCADYTVKVTSDKDSVNVTPSMDWKLTTPANVTINVGFGGPVTDQPGEVGPGGTKSGGVCFETDAVPGQYTLKYETSLSLSRESAEWTATL
ncbi:DUF4352 domain-containing protein [Corynebacterium bovis]|uniref:DUF4352 domain-containing protein n=1 Tax=Corynebacterium bovis TaxID=36808 RepID=UPI003138EE10